MWFAVASLPRDLAAILGCEALPWDYWGPTACFRKDGLGPLLERLERLARDLFAADRGALDPGQVLERHRWTARQLSLGEPLEMRLSKL